MIFLHSRPRSDHNTTLMASPVTPLLGTAMVVVLATLTGISEGSSPGYRVLQAETGSKSVGSNTYSAEGHLTLPLEDGKPFKAVMVLAVNSTKPERLAEFTERRSGLSGVLLVLPNSSEPPAALSAGDSQQLIQLEQQLLSGPTAVPVFVTYDTPELAAAVAETAAMFARGSAPSKSSDRYELTIQGHLPKKLTSKTATNYVATLRSSDDQGKAGVPQAPTLLITAHFDAFSLAPAASAGADTAASGAAASLLLLRLLHRLYSSPETRPSRNVMVLLTSGGPYNQMGLQKWVQDADPAFLETIDGAVVLDSIGASTAVQQQQQQQQQESLGSIKSQAPQLHIHGTSSSDWVAAVAAAADRLGVSAATVDPQLQQGLEFQGQNPPPQAPDGDLGHVHLSGRGVPAVSLSHLPGTARLGVPRLSSLSDTVPGVQLDKAIEATQVAAEAVTRWLYPHLDEQHRLIDLAAQQQQHRDFLTAWMDLMTSADNMMPFDKGDGGSSLLHDSLQQFLRAHSHSSKKHLWATTGTPAAITAWSGTTAVIKVYKQAGFTLDMILTAAIVLYLMLLFATLTVVTRGFSELKALFMPKPTRRQSRGSSKRNS